MHSAGKPVWQQLTALVSLGASGAVTGFTFTPRTAADLTSPASLPVHLLALARAAKPAAGDATLRSAIVNFAHYYLRMAQGKTAAEMESIIWQHDSVNGVDHGQSCAAFASLTLELAAQAVGQHSWVTGGTSYPWPLHKWVDARVDPNSASPGITSVLQDAEAHHRWHPVGDGYQPLPGDWVLFAGHIEVVTNYAGGVLYTVGGDSLPNFSVNAHQYHDPLAAQGISGFVNNGNLHPAAELAPHPQAQARDHRARRREAPGPAVSTDPPAAAATDPPAAVNTDPAAAAATDPPAAVSTDPAAAAAGPAAVTGPTAATGPAGAAGPSAAPGATAPATDQPAPGAELAPVADPPTTDANPPSAVADVPGAIAGVPAAVAGAAAAAAASTQAAAPADGVVIPGQPAAEPRPAREKRSARHRTRRVTGCTAGAQQAPAPAASRTPGQVGSGRSTDRPGVPGPATKGPATAGQGPARPGMAAEPSVPGVGYAGPVAAGQPAAPGTAQIPGLPFAPLRLTLGAVRPAAARRSHHLPAASLPVAETPAQQAFINEVAPGAVDAQRRYGVPASVTIAQAIVESGWGQSQLATQDHNLFGIKGTGPAGSVRNRSWEYQNGQAVIQTSPFRVYRSAAESIDDHGRLLASSEYYRRAMADRRDPNAFAASLTGTYATDPEYGTKLISLMRRYNLYRYDVVTHPSPARPVPPDSLAIQGSVPAGPVPPVSPPPVITLPVMPQPVITQPAITQPAVTPASPQAASPQPSVSQPASPQPTVTQPAATQPAVTQPASSQPAATRPAATWPGSAEPTGRPRATLNPPASHPPISHPPISPQPTVAAPGIAPAIGREPASPRQAALQPGLAPPVAVPPISIQSPSAPPAGSQPAGMPQAGAPMVSQRPGPEARRAPSAGPSRTATATTRAVQFKHHIPLSVRHSFTTTAKVTLIREEPLYRDVASSTGLDWQLLAACDWMQCEARPRYSPVRGEKLGTVNPDGTAYRTKSEALAQCAEDLVELALTVYGIDLTAPGLSVRDLASAFAAFRWGGLLKLHHTSALEFPYSVAGLTDQYTSMRWPNIADPNTPDKPGGRFRKPFGAVPIVLILNYPATV